VDRRYFYLLFVCLVSIGMGQTLTFAVLPPLAREMGLSEFQVGSIFAISAILWVFSSPFWGRRSDLWGRRPVIMIGIAGYVVSMTAFGLTVHAGLAGWMALIPVYLLMIMSRTVFGLFGSATMPAAQAFVAERTAPAERSGNIALLQAGMATGTTLGPGVVSLFMVISLTAPFWGVALLGLASLTAIGLLLPGDRKTDGLQAGSSFTRERVSPLDTRLWPYLVVGVAAGVCQATTMQTAGFYVIDVLGMSIEQAAKMVGVALMGSASAGLFCQLVIIRMLRPSPRTMLLVGGTCGVLCFTVMIAFTSFAAMFVGMVLLGMAFGMVRPGSAAGASLAVSADEQGAVAGLMNVTGALGVLLAPFVGMSLYRVLPEAPYMLNFVLCISILLMVTLHPRLRRARVAPPQPISGDSDPSV